MRVNNSYNLAKGLVQILGVAMGYFIAGKLALMLAIPPGYATAVWPAAGIALAGCLLFGNRVCLGILVGSFFVNIGTSFDTTSVVTVLRSILLAASIGFGAVIQALFGAGLIRRFAKYPKSLDEESTILKLLILGGLVSCLLNATWSVTSLCVSGAIPWDHYAFSWFTWWVGDAIGVLIFTPLILLWADTSNNIGIRRQISVTLPLCVVFISIVLLYIYTSAREQDQFKFEFEKRTDALANMLKSNVYGHLDALQSLESYYSSSAANIKRSEFHAFVTHLLSDHHPGLLALSWNPRVKDHERAEFERAAEAEGFVNFHITEQTTDRKLVQAKKRFEYTPVLYIEPYENNKNVSGFDVKSDSVRQEALFKTRDTGQPAATKRIFLIQSQQNKYGILVYTAIYKFGSPHTTIEQRRQNLIGYVVGVFQISDLLEILFKSMEHEGIALELLDESAPENERQLYASSSSEQPKMPPLFSRNIFFDLAGRQWALKFHLNHEYAEVHRSLQAWSILTWGLLFTGLLGAFLLIMTGRTKVIEELVVKRTSELQDALSMITATLESTADGILVVDAEGKMTHFNQKFIKMWCIPETILTARSDEKALAFVLDQLKDPDSFLKKVRELYADPGEESLDVLEFKDGRFFERSSMPHKNAHVRSGRVWSFRDITESKRSEELLKKTNDKLSIQMQELQKLMEVMMGREERIIELKKRLESLTEQTGKEFKKTG